jgi:formylglycine-generating enzyme required for sulfatase activity
MYDIFLSYRRKDAMGNSNVATARTFKLEFERRGMKVFFDYSECTDDYFSDTILPAIRTCRYFVLVLTKDCLDRCKDEGDWLRREIAEAIKYGRKIIPISPDGVFEGWPKVLPEAIGQLSAGDGLQITTIHMDRVFESNVELLINDRMGGLVKKETERWKSGAGTYLKVTCNMDCVMYIDGEEYGTLSAGRLQKIPLAEGEYMLEFESVENGSDRINAPFEMPNKDKLYNVDLLAKKDERERKAREERERREREERERKAREEQERKERERREREERGEFEVDGVQFKLVKVEGGTFTMGATVEQVSAWDREKPAHKVSLSDYYIGETQVTQALWKAVMGDNPSFFEDDDNLPVEKVSWEDIVEKFIPALNRKTGHTFRLPTEAEWEYAARGGGKSKGYKYSGSDNIDEVAWYNGNSGRRTYLVRGKRANELGLYDMSGNVWEWCHDWYGDYSSGTQTNPKGSNTGSIRVLRGGSWGTDTERCRVSYRYRGKPDTRSYGIGFRLVLCP